MCRSVAKTLHLLLQTINRYRTSKHLKPHDSLTIYHQELKSGTKFGELNENISYTFHTYERVIESCTTKDGTAEVYKRVTRVDYNKPVKDICKYIMETGNSHLKRGTYVNNVSVIFPGIKSAYDVTLIEPDFSQNLALGSKDEV